MVDDRIVRSGRIVAMRAGVCFLTVLFEKGISMRVLTYAGVLAFALSIVCGHVSAGQIRLIDDSQDTRPEMWKEADGQSVLMAEEVARTDAWAKLAEFVAGMEVKGAISVRDMVDVDKELVGRIRARLNNMATQAMVYHDNGVVQCMVVARLSDLVESVESFLSEDKVDGVTVDKEHFRRYNLEPGDREVTMWGNGGLFGTDGVEIVQAIRAAELDAAAQMVAMLEGVRIGRQTVVRDFVLASDRMKACIDDAARGIQYTEYDILAKTVEVEAQVKFVTVIERIERVYEELFMEDLCTGCPIVEKSEFEEVTRREETTVHSVIGKAARVAGGVQTRPVNAERAMKQARAANSKTETVYEREHDDGGDSFRTVRREVVKETVVGQRVEAE